MARISFRKISYAGIFILWVAATALLLFRHYGLNQNIEHAAYKGVLPKELYEEQWMGVYYKGEKIGYSIRKVDKWDRGYKISEFLTMSLNVMNSQREIETVTCAYLDSDFGLNSFELALKSDISMNIKGKIEGKNLKISIEAPGTKSERTISLKDKPSLNLSIIPNVLKEGIKPGKKFSMVIIDPSTLSQDNMLIEIKGEEQIMAMGTKRNVFKLKGTFKGSEFYVWLTEKGEVLREETLLGFMLVKEAKETAMQIGKPSLDLIAQIAVPFNLRLPSDTKYLRIRLSGVDFKGLELDGGRQKFKGDLLEIRKEDLRSQVSGTPSIPPFLKGGEGGLLDEYLKDTMFVQSKDPQIVALSREIVRNENDAVKAARLIYEWVYKNIEKVPTITIPMATEVLKTKRGDCNEHTTLFTALARAAGIPARIAIGLTYKEGYFFYHAWPEIFIGQWVAIDPTLGQFPADAAHIRLITGDIDKQVQILPVIGKIKIEGLEYR